LSNNVYFLLNNQECVGLAYLSLFKISL